jgi:hypothetical protein
VGIAVVPSAPVDFFVGVSAVDDRPEVTAFLFLELLFSDEEDDEEDSESESESEPESDDDESDEPEV